MATTNPRLTELHIEGFKSIQNQTIPLSPLTVLIGANGAGKSNLIQFFGMLSEMVNGRLQKWVAQKAGADQILYFGTKETPVIQSKVTIGFPQLKPPFQYGYSFVLAANDANSLYYQTEKVHWEGGPFRLSFDPDLKNDGGMESKLHAWPSTEGTIPVQNETHIKKLAKDVRKMLQECQAFQFHDTSVESRLRKPSAERLDRSLAANGSNLPTWLYRLQQTHPQQFDFIQKNIAQVFPDFGGFELSPDPVTGMVSLLWYHKQSRDLFAAHQLSDGTLRFIALCALLLQPTELMPDIVLIDEPELGLHPAALQLVAAMARSVVKQGKQIIMTTQSSTFLSCFAPENVVVVERKDGASIFKPALNLGISLDDWLKEYESLGTLWEMNLLGGRP
ncbi:MAG TPA: AAA family ATPase [Fibrobacteraceae bacterium]|nr:AAA family ATPase [Fibrobacteraceae bacterium]